MKRQIRAIISRLPGGGWLFRKYDYYRLKLDYSRMGNVETMFTHFYSSNFWKDDESRSGTGSSLRYTENIRKEIPPLLKRLDVRTILDAPCGDFNWFRLVEREDHVDYIGGDIVAPLIERNQELYGNERTRFVHLNILHDELPDADLWLCRDCLFHLSYDDIFSVIDNFLASNIGYLLATTHTECTTNTNIPTGAWRPLNLELPPFSFSKPSLYIKDWIEGNSPRHLALWNREELSSALASNKGVLRRLRHRGRASAKV